MSDIETWLSGLKLEKYNSIFAEAEIEAGYSTRIGAAMRHAAEDLKRQQTHRRLLLVVTYGEPSDIDVTDRKYLVEDACGAYGQPSETSKWRTFKPALTRPVCPLVF
jgi:hypothetical protein